MVQRILLFSAIRQQDGPNDHQLELSGQAPTTQEELCVTGTRGGEGEGQSQGEEDDTASTEPHPLMNSNSEEREEWITVSATHPLVSSDS